MSYQNLPPRSERRAKGYVEIEELKSLGYSVRRFATAQFRINGILDVYVTNSKYHVLKTGERGTYEDMVSFVQNSLSEHKGLSSEQPIAS